MSETKPTTTLKAVGVYADKGRRRTMEDCHSVVDPWCGDGAYVAVFDGHGGKSASEWCRNNLAAVIASHIKETTADAEGAFTAAFREADDALVKAGVEFAGCTATVCVVRGNRLRVANVGDTHAMLCSDGGATHVRLTAEHRCGGADKTEEALVTSKGGFITGDRVNGMLAVTRTLGDHNMKAFITCDPAVSGEVVLRGDGSQTLLVACDGLWDHVSNEDAAKIACEAADPAVAAKELVVRAIKAGSQDNITVVVARI
jgi:serine/threonine protein phosphatase PrpC